MDKQPVFKFRVISLGKATQQLEESNNYINRPFLQIDDVRKKWGDEYVVVNSLTGDVGDKPRSYLGSVDLDRRNRKFLKLFKEIDFYIEKPDYFVININHVGSQIDKNRDFYKYNSDSISCILSSAYHSELLDTTTDMIIICQDGDAIMIDGLLHVFNKSNYRFEPEE